MKPLPVHYDACPVCGGTAIRKILALRDFSVSGEDFDLWECSSCRLRFTQDVPGPEQIGRYYQSADYISHSDSRRGLVNRLYHLVRRITIRSKVRLAGKLTGLSSGVLLDVGAGTGAFVGAMQQAGWQTTGVEPDPGARQKARELYGVNLIPSEDLGQLPADNYDLITLWHVLEHVHDLHGYLEMLSRLLKPGGYLLLAVPNYTSFDASHYGEYWAAYDVPRHLYHFSPDAMRALLKIHRLRLENVLPMKFDSYYVSLLSEKYRTGRQSLLRAARTGFRSNQKAARETERYSSLIYVVRPE